MAGEDHGGSDKSVAQRLIVPGILFALFVGLGLFSQDLVSEFGIQAIERGRDILSKVVQIGIWLASAFLINRLMTVFFWELIVERAVGGPIPRLVKDVVAAVILLTAISGIVGFVFGLDITGIWATSGAVGIVVGFALRSMILDVATGVAVGIDRPYRLGDWIQLHQRQRDLFIVGRVEQINWRTTRLKTTDNNLVIIPNSVMGQTVVTNFMAPDATSRLEIYLVLDLHVPSERALRVLGAAAKAVCTGDVARIAAGEGEGVPLASPKPKARITRVNTIGIEYRIRYWVVPADCSPNKSRHIVVSSVLEHLRQAGLTLAYPKRDVFTTEMPPRALDASSPADLMALFGRIELFEHLADEELSLLVKQVIPRRYRAGDRLIKAGDDGETMFVLVEGLVYVFATLNGSESEVQVAQIVPGQFFGEMSLLTGEARSATITAASDAVAYEITKSAMHELLRRRPELAETISAIVAERKLRNQQAGERTTTLDRIERKSSVAGQILDGIRSFFRGVFD